MDLFKSRRSLLQFLWFGACFCFALLGSSLTDAHENVTWVTHPASQTVETGGTVTFNCKAEYHGHDNGSIEYQWKYNNKPIQVASKPRFTTKANGTMLEIMDSKLEDQGTYQCYIRMKGNTTQLGESKSATLIVKDKTTASPPTKIQSNLTWITHPESKEVEAGSNVTFGCSAKHDKNIEYHWRHNNETIKKDARCVIHDDGTLAITNVRLEDRGAYQCYVTIVGGGNILGESKTAALDVKDDGPSEEDESVKKSSLGKTVGIAVGVAGAYIVVVVILMMYLERRRARKSRKEEHIPADCENGGIGGLVNYAVEGEDGMTMNSMNGGPRSSLRMEFPRHRLTELRSLGNGAYGQAFLARASGKREGDKAVTVVVKSLVNGDDRVREAFNKEMNALCGLRHDNVVTLLGVCKEDEPLYMIFESMEKSDLKLFLLYCSYNGLSTINANQKLDLCGQVAAGMNYLSSHNFVHKDLAARNCMIGRDLQVKIGFLSLSCDRYKADYYCFNNKQIPLRWMPPEAIFDDNFSAKSDVWSYGVLVWEIYNFGQMPYHERSNEEVLKSINDDLRLPSADNCPDAVLELMEKCWRREPLTRPTFQEITDDLSGINVTCF